MALVRSPGKATPLSELGCELVEGDLSSIELLRSAMNGCVAVVHLAAVYKVGIPASERAGVFAANVTGTENVLDAAIAQGVEKIVYVSTVGAFGNTRGEVVDETFERTDLDFLSVYDETKYLAHQAARARIAQGAPIVIAQPGGVYGPNDPSDLGNLFAQVRKGRMKAFVFPEVGFNFAHVEDIAAGIILVLDEGRIGESYVLGGELATMRDLITKLSVLYAKKAPRATVPPLLIKSLTPIGSVVGKLLDLPPNLRELIKSAEGVTYYATDAKARAELGYSARDLDTGLRQTVAAA